MSVAWLAIERRKRLFEAQCFWLQRHRLYGVANLLEVSQLCTQVRIRSQLPFHFG